MKALLWVCLLSIAAAPAGAQMQLPPGTTSAADDSARSAAQTAAPNRTAADQSKAEEAISHGDYASAAQILKSVTAQDPKNERAMYELGYAEDAAGDAVSAEKDYRAAISLNPQDAEALTSLGLLLARSGDTKQAADQLRAATGVSTAEAPVRARAYRALARLELNSDPSAARDALVHALQLSPETSDDTLLSGEIAESMGDAASADKSLSRVMAETKASPEATAAYGRALAHQGKQDQAQTVLSQGLAAHPGDPQITSELASLYISQKQLERAIPLLESLHKQDPSNAAVTQTLAHTYSALDRPRQAIPLLQSMLAASPDDAAVRADLGDALILTRQYPEAESELGKALAHPESFPDAQRLADAAGAMAFAATQTQNPQAVLQAVALHDKATAPSAGTAFLAATAYDRLHQSQEALSAYRQFLSLANGSFPDQEWQAKQRIQALGGGAARRK